MGRDAISDRVYKTVIYSDEDLEKAYNEPSGNDVDLQTLEIAFDRTCNFGCSYCNPAFSSTWVKDINTNGPFTGLVSDGRNHFTHSHDSSQLYRFGEYNPYTEAFFKWWESDLHRTLKELRVTGGEPLMSGETWKLLDWFKTNTGKSTTRLAINSNLGEQCDIDRLLDSTKGLVFDLYTSNEAMGLQAEYIRDGLNWRAWTDNMHKLASSGQLRGLHVMCTINALCLDSLPEFLEFMLQYKSKYGKDFPTFSLNILRFPSFQSPLVLPDSLRTKYKNRLQDWFNCYKESPLLHQMEVNQVARLIDYLDVVKTPHADAAEQSVLQQDFKQFYTQYDQRRSKDISEAFPGLMGWYKTL